MTEFTFSALDYVTGKNPPGIPGGFEGSPQNLTEASSEDIGEFSLKPSSKYYDMQDSYAGRRGGGVNPNQTFNRGESGVFAGQQQQQQPGYGFGNEFAQGRPQNFNGLERSGDSMIPQHLRNKIMMSSAMNQGR